MENSKQSELYKRMPILFVGHGSPMNAIEDNDYTKNWGKIADEIPKPKAILAISAHWYTDGSRINDEAQPKMVYDMYGFPNALYQIQYKAKGAPELAHITKELIKREVEIDNNWGYDHGTWSILCRMYPKADIPVYQLSVDSKASAEEHFSMGQQISKLRENGVLIFASGNVVHNLSRLDWGMKGGHPWAVDFDNYIKEKIINRQYYDVINYSKFGNNSKLSVPTPEHFYPLLYILGASKAEDNLVIFNNSCTMGSLSMTSYLFK